MGGHVSVVIKHKNEFKSVESYTGSYQSLLYSTESLNNELEASIDKYVSNKEEGVCAPVGYGLL